MEQRPLRLGDIVDDYCPRERRVTNHAIVAIVGDSIRQTRCTTCEAEHVYKAAKVPLRRKNGAADKGSADLAGGQLVPPRPAVDAFEHDGDEPDRPDVRAASSERGSSDAAQPDDESGQSDPENSDDRPVDEAWSAHRPLIRATLPRNDGEPAAPRPIPEFTMYQRNMRGSRQFRQGQGWPSGNGFDRNGSWPQGPNAGPPGPGRPGRRGRRRGRGRKKESR
jgi:hypothetical protein